MDKAVLVELREGVATLTLNRADSGNVRDMAMGRDLSVTLAPLKKHQAQPASS